MTPAGNGDTYNPRRPITLAGPLVNLGRAVAITAGHPSPRARVVAVARDREDDEHVEGAGMNHDVGDEHQGIEAAEAADLDDDDLDLDDEDLDLDDDDLDLDDDDLELDDLDLDDLDDEDLDLKEAFGLPDRLPPLRLPPEAELAAMSRTSPLLERVHRLAEWAVGRELNWNEELTAGDTVAAARELGIAVPPEAGTGGGALPDEPGMTSMRDVPDLAWLWDIALDIGFIDPDLEGERVQPGEDVGSWPGGTDQEVLDLWSAALPSVLELVVGDDEADELLDFTDAGWALIVMLFLAREAGASVREASDMIREASTEELASAEAERAWATCTAAHGDPAETLLAQLADLGAVSLDDQPPGESGDDGRAARLTPLGMWALRELLTEDGVEIPLLPPSGL
jgi:hypothetical protein